MTLSSSSAEVMPLLTFRRQSICGIVRMAADKRTKESASFNKRISLVVRRVADDIVGL